MYIYEYAYVRACVNICTRVCVCVPICIRDFLCVSVCGCTGVFMCACVFLCVIDDIHYFLLFNVFSRWLKYFTISECALLLFFVSAHLRHDRRASGH